MIYIQTAQGLNQVSPSLTKDKIIAALGYTPADNNIFYEDKSGALILTDEKGYIIARIDENGLRTTQISADAVILNDENLSEKLKKLEEKVPDIDLSNYALSSEVETLINSHATNEDIHILATERLAWNAKSNFSGKYADLQNAPHIINNNEDEVVICDSQGNVILRATAEGLNVAAVYINGKTAIPAYDDSMEGAVLKIIDGAPTWVSET